MNLISRCRLLAVCSCLLGVPVLSLADYIFLNDGYTLRGRKVVRESEEVVDRPSGKSVAIAKLNGFYLVDADSRKIVFSQKNVGGVRKEEGTNSEEVFFFTQPRPHQNAEALTTIYEVKELSPWDARARRRVKVIAGEGKYTVDQCVTMVRPGWVRANAQHQHWYCSFLTSEFDPHVILGWIRGRNKPKNTNPLDEHFKIFRFCTQAGWYELADRELQKMTQEFPQEQEKIEPAMKDLRRLQAERSGDQIDIASKAGQHESVQQMLAKFANEHAPAAVLDKVRNLKTYYEEQTAKLKDLRRLLGEAAVSVKNQTLPREFIEALEEINHDLHYDTSPRLEAFHTLALQEERQRQQKKDPSVTPEQLLALAVSGWAVGNQGAETKVETAVRLWRTRRLIMRYARTLDVEERKQLLPSYSAQPDAPGVDVVAQLILHLPPPDLEKDPPKDAIETKTLPVKDKKEQSYHLLLPPEYRHQRSYPVLMVLHNAGEPPRDALEVWRELAAKHGYILAAPKWSDSFATNYESTEEARESVLAVIRDLRRRFNIDSERVFMFGWANSGIMAYDVGLHYPDWFAGVAVMCGRPRTKKAFHNNAQALPFYVVDGEFNGKGPEENRELFQTWMPRGYPSLYVEYKGRGFEFFRGEMPIIFEWMSHRKRVLGGGELGKKDPLGGSMGQEYGISSKGYSRFYWVSTDGVVNPESATPPKVAGRLRGNNQIFVYTSGLKQVSVWLNSRMVDFEQPVEIRIFAGTLRPVPHKLTIKPSLEVLLEDFYERGDKKNLFVAKKDFRW